MKLMMKAFEDAHATCEGLQQLRELASQEEYGELMSEIMELDRAVCSAAETLNMLEEHRAALVKCGYSDEWFDQIREMKSIEGLVTFDMPKFFDNNANRQTVCLEGFAEAIKDWIKKIWEFLKRCFKAIYAAIEWFVKNFRNANAQSSKVLDQWRKAVDEVKDVYFQNNKITIEAYWDMDFVQKQLEQVNKFIEALYKDQKLNPIFDAEMANIDPRNAKKDFFDRLLQAVDAAGIDRSGSEGSAMFFRYDAGSSSVVKFLGVDINKEFPKEDLHLDEAQDLQVKIEILKNGWDEKFEQALVIMTSFTQYLKQKQASYQQLIDGFDTLTGDSAVLRQAQVGLIETNCMLVTVNGAIRFYQVLEAKLQNNRTKMVAALRAIKAGK